MIMFLRIRHTLAGLDRGHTRPRLWAKGAQRQGGLPEQGDHDGDPAAPKGTHQAQTGRPALAALVGQRGHTSSRVLAGIVSSAKPPTLSSHSVATATASHRRAARAGWVMRVCCHGQPARVVL